METVLTHLPELLRGALTTVEVSGATIGLASLLGILIILMRFSGVTPLVWIARVYTDVLQNVPYLIVVFLLYFGLPEFGIYPSVVAAAIGGLSLYSAAYLAEALRTGYLSIPAEQLAGATAFGLSGAFIGIRIIVPQAVIYGMPAVTNQWIRVIMNSTVLSIVGGSDLLDRSRELAGETFQIYAFYATAALGYWLLVAPLAIGMKWLEEAPRWRRAQIGLAERRFATTIKRGVMR